MLLAWQPRDGRLATTAVAGLGFGVAAGVGAPGAEVGAFSALLVDELLHPIRSRAATPTTPRISLEGSELLPGASNRLNSDTAIQVLVAVVYSPGIIARCRHPCARIGNALLFRDRRRRLLPAALRDSMPPSSKYRLSATGRARLAPLIVLSAAAY